MPIQSPGFRRLVLGLQASAPDRSVHFAAELAGLLQLELLGLFLDDSSLRDLAGIPFARELRELTGEWQPMDLERISRELEHQARNLERMFKAAAQGLPTRSHFEVLRGSARGNIASISRTDDIFMLVEPRSPVERGASQFAWLSEAASRSAAAVLLVPARIVRNKGPIVAIAATPDDPSIHAAATIALATKEELVIIDADHHGAGVDHARQLGGEGGLKVEQMTAARGVFPDPSACAQAFRHLQERFVVISRGAFDDSVASTIASVRKVPVLVIEPPKGAASAGGA